MRDRKSLKILLIEARLDQAMIDHEIACLLRAGKLNENQLVPYSVLDGNIGPEHAKGYDAVILGGTGDYSVVNDRPVFYEPLLEFTRYLIANNIPLLGLCYGHQLIAQAAGGQVITDHEREETGTYEMYLTEEGRKDIIMRGLPDHFPAQQGHHDGVISMPEDYIRLAYSERCVWQALRHKTAPVYGTQFHPELLRSDLVKRMMTYADIYASEPGRLEAVLDAIKETDNQTVIEYFIDDIILPSARLKDQAR